MASGRWRIASGLLVVPAVVGGLAACSGGGQSATTSATASTTSSNGEFSAAKLQKALLTQVNGVAPAAPATSGNYSSVSQTSASKQGTVQVSPKACSQAATEGFDPSALSGAPAAGVTFKVGTNGVSEVLVASSAKSASSALAGQVPAQCTRYQETVNGKTYTYGVKEDAVKGIGEQAKVLYVHAVGANADDLWSLIYRGTGFVGTVTVIGPNASEAAVQQLGQQAYSYAVKSLA